MPLYEYTCRDCDETFEALVNNGEAVACPGCQGERLERLFSLPARPPESASVNPRCDPSLPPCGPACRRFGNN